MILNGCDKTERNSIPNYRHDVRIQVNLIYLFVPRARAVEACDI